MRVQALFIHPVKACRAIACDEISLTALGAEQDRRFAFVADDGLTLTQRDQPLLASVVPSLGDSALRLDFGGLLQLAFPFAQFLEPTRVDVWGNSVSARAVADGFMGPVVEYLGTRARLVMLDPQSPRAFVDSRPVLVTTTKALALVNRGLATAVGMERFRPNVVLEGEDGASALEGSEARLERDKPCGRCEVTTIDQASGQRRGPEPLRTLSERFAGNFGIYYRVTRPGKLRRGEILKAS
jgi:uncharacterized protein YcbX